MQSQFLTKNERVLVKLLKEGPKQYTEIINVSGKKKKSTTNNLLKRMEGKKIFRVERQDGKVFYRLNIFPDKIRVFFTLADYMNEQSNDQAWRILLEIKNEILRLYPGRSFEKILKRHRDYLKLTKPELKGIIQILKDFEGDSYEHPFG